MLPLLFFFSKPSTDFHCRTSYSGQLIIDVTYGIPILSRDHKLIKTAEAVMHSIGVALSPVFSVFNLTPLCEYHAYTCAYVADKYIVQALPHWLGGGRFLDLVQKWQSDARALHEVPFDMVKASMVRPLSANILSTTLHNVLGFWNRKTVVCIVASWKFAATG